MNTSELKAMARKAGFSERKIAHGQGLDDDANAQLTSYLKEEDQALVIAAYMPIRTEVSPLPSMKRMAMRGRRICVPVIVAKGQALEFHEWTPDCEMIEGPFGAFVPKNGAVLVPDILITPLVAFDSSGYRLGYGGGFYDRSFAQISEQKNIKAIGFAYSEQELMIVPREETDYKLDAVITEKGILSF